MTRILTSVLAVDVDGAPLPDQLNALLLEGWVDTSVTVPAAFGLVFSDPYGTVLRDNRQLTVGAKVKLSAITDGTRSDPLLTGEITALEMDADTAGRTLLVRGYDPGHRLVRVRRVEGYPNMTAADIVRKLAGQAGVRVGRIDPTPTVYDLATQPNLTDWDFLTRLARENDVRLYFDEDGALQFRELPKATSAPSDTTPSTQSPYVLEFGTNTQRSRVGLTASGQVKKVEVRGWDVKTKRALLLPLLVAAELSRWRAAVALSCCRVAPLPHHAVTSSPITPLTAPNACPWARCAVGQLDWTAWGSAGWRGTPWDGAWVVGWRGTARDGG